jgi:3-isopropylmalate/(R)-2-methylmalate dehydratase small subunit
MSGAIATVTGRVHRLGDNVDTDAILPGRYLALRDPAALGAHCLEALDPGFRARVTLNDVVVAGRNFGSGSSREHAVVALKAVGIRAIVAASVARIFFRNAINLGLPVIVCPEAANALVSGEEASVSVTENTIRQGAACWQTAPLGQEVTAILASGGLTQLVRHRLAAAASAT